MKCAEFRAMAESYQAGELPVDTSHEVIAHLDRCAGCRGELESRVALRQTLRHAFAQAPALAPDARFVANLRATLLTKRSAAHQRFGVSASWLAMAAGVALIVALGWQVARLERHGVGSRAAGASGPSTASALAAHAAGDHRDCALEHALDDPVISLEEAGRRYNPLYASLRDVVAGSAPIRDGDMEILGAHWCVFRGRQFGHVIVGRGGRIVSILVTPTDQASASLHVDACRSADGLQVACFDAQGHGVFVVSDLAEGEILQLARSLAPVLRAHLARV